MTMKVFSEVKTQLKAGRNDNQEMSPFIKAWKALKCAQMYTLVTLPNENLEIILSDEITTEPVYQNLKVFGPQICFMSR